MSCKQIHYLHEVISQHLLFLLERLVVIELARSRSVLLILHDFLSKSLASILKEFSSATLSFITPVLMLQVFGPGDKLKSLCLKLNETLHLLVVGGIADADAVLDILFGRSIEGMTERIVVLRASNPTHR